MLMYTCISVMICMPYDMYDRGIRWSTVRVCIHIHTYVYIRTPTHTHTHTDSLRMHYKMGMYS